MGIEGDQTPTEKNVAALNARVLILTSERDQAVKERDEALLLLKQANDLIEGDTKARLVEQALDMTTMSLNELAGKDIGELETIITVSNLAKKPRFEAAVPVGLHAGREEKFNASTHLHSLYLGNKKG